MNDTQTMTTLRVTLLGGPRDGWNGRVSVPLQSEAAGRIRLKGTVYRVHRQAGRVFLVHPDAVRLLWRSS